VLWLLLDRLNWNLNLTMADHESEHDRDTNAVEPNDDWTLNATLTTGDGRTTTISGFSITDANADFRDGDQFTECSAGLSDAFGDAQQDIQLSVEVPTKAVACANCDHENHVPVWAFVKLSFGDNHPLNGEYAIGHQCEQCGFPY